MDNYTRFILLKLFWQRAKTISNVPYQPSETVFGNLLKENGIPDEDVGDLIRFYQHDLVQITKLAQSVADKFGLTILDALGVEA